MDIWSTIVLVVFIAIGLKEFYDALIKDLKIKKLQLINFFYETINNYFVQIIFFLVLGILISFIFYIIYLKINQKIEETEERSRELDKKRKYVKEFLETDLRGFNYKELKSKLNEINKKDFLEEHGKLDLKLDEAKKILVKLKYEEEIRNLKLEKQEIKDEIEEMGEERENCYKTHGKFEIANKDNFVGKPQREVKINVNEHKRFFRIKKLNRDEVRYLLDEDYSFYKRKSLVSGKIENFLIKPRHNESAQHHFVIYDLAEYLESLGIEVMKYVTRKPDILFEINGKRYAIEVETGSAFSKIKNLKEKVKLLNKNYDEWFFVVTKRGFVKKYKKFGSSVDVRYLPKKIKKLLKNSQK